MNKINNILLLFMLLAVGANAQTAYNPFTQNIHFAPEPTVAGFQCGTTQTVEFTQGFTTAANATQWQTNPLTVTICVTGFTFTGSASSIVSGSYAQYFDWAYDSFAPGCVIGTQNQTLHGVGSNPLFPDPMSSGSIAVTLTVPETSPIGTILAVNVNLQVPGYMQMFNSAPDDNESVMTQTFCPLMISGTVYNDRNGDANVNGLPISAPDGSPLFANLFDSVGVVVAVVPVNANGTYQFLNVNPYTTYAVSVGTIPGVIGSIVPNTSLPGSWMHTGEDCCDMVGTDGIVDGITIVNVTNFRKFNVDFGMKDPNAFNLPLVLKNFFVSEYNCTGLLSWTTSQEMNTSHVDIYRKTEQGLFEKIATVQSAGNSTSEKVYSYIDKDIVSDKVYEYKLKFVDIDGQFTESDIRSLSMNCTTQSNSINIFPNPASSELNILYVTESEEAALSLSVNDITGRTILTKSQTVKSGPNVITFDLSHLAVGTYMLRYYDDESLNKGTLQFIKK